MKQLLQEIRGAFSLSQERFADLLGTTFATVNRWENGRTVPGRKTQDKIMRLCSDQGIQLYELVMDHIRKESFVSLVPNRVLLYHGSKSGLTGAIAPISRDKCDFGRGFYIRTDPVQLLMWLGMDIGNYMFSDQSKPETGITFANMADSLGTFFSRLLKYFIDKSNEAYPNLFDVAFGLLLILCLVDLVLPIILSGMVETNGIFVQAESI